MRRLMTCSILALLVASPAFSQETDGIIERPELRDLESQDLDPNQALLDALRRNAIKPAEFAVSSDRVRVEGEVGKEVTTVFSLRNKGQEAGKIFGIDTVIPMDGLAVTSSCEEFLEPGQRCDVTISFTSGRPRDIQTAIVANVEGDEKSEISIPLSIVISEPPKVEEPEPPKPVVVQVPESVVQQEPKGPTSEDVARRYFQSMGGMRPTQSGSGKGFSIVSAEPAPPTPGFAGVRYDDMWVETIFSEDRYPDAVASTEASLPVDRSKILTADRVIKAVLETPVSNIMCGKVVAMVESDVYSATSSAPLIQAGSRVVGQCGSFVGERAGIEWTRIITTDGRSISLDLGADTRDAMGLGGALGRVHSSAFDKYGLPIISTMIDATAGVIFAAFGKDETVVTEESGRVISETSASNEGIRIVTGEARGTAQQIISDIRDVREVAVIPAGSRIDIEISEDVYFKTSKQVVRLADMTFDLEEISKGQAARDLPASLSLIPAEPEYEGPVIWVGGRAYKVEETLSAEEIEALKQAGKKSAPTLDDITQSRSAPGADG